MLERTVKRVGIRPERINECLGEAVQEVLETMFFLSVEGSAAWDEAAESLHVTVDFHGPVEGRMDLAIYCALAAPLAASFAGREESEMGPDETGEVLCEMANMLCGSLLSRLETDALFSLSPPRMVEESPAAPGVCRAFDTGLGVVRVCISMCESADDREPE